MYDTTPAAEAIVSRVFHLLTGAEAARMMASLEIDLDQDETYAVARALRTLARTRASIESAHPRLYAAQMAEIEALMQAPQPIPAPRDWNDESRTIVATYASPIAPGYHLNVEPVDQGDYSPYFRSSSQRNTMEVFA